LWPAFARNLSQIVVVVIRSLLSASSACGVQGGALLTPDATMPAQLPACTCVAHHVDEVLGMACMHCATLILALLVCFALAGCHSDSSL
jgi:hypothetical protein